MEAPYYARQAYNVELRELEHDLLDMGSRADAMIGQAVESLRTLDTALAMEVLRKDDEVDQLDLGIESRCLRLLALQSPTGRDLRTIGTVIKVITDIERIGDLAVDIAKIAMKVEKELGDTTFVDIPRMAGVARTMFREALEAYVRRDLERVREVCTRDNEVDGLYRELRGQIFENMRAHNEAVVTDGWLLMAIHHIERIADHTVNIAERVEFMVTGKLKTHPEPA